VIRRLIWVTGPEEDIHLIDDYYYQHSFYVDEHTKQVMGNYAIVKRPKFDDNGGMFRD
jgi:hypothetical protein